MGHPSKIQDVLAKTDFLDTPPPPLSNIVSLEEIPPPRQKTSESRVKRPKRKLYSNLDAQRRGRGGGLCRAPILTPKHLFIFVCGRPVDTFPWSSTFSWPPHHRTGRLWWMVPNMNNYLNGGSNSLFIWPYHFVALEFVLMLISIFCMFMK